LPVAVGAAVTSVDPPDGERHPSACHRVLVIVTVALVKLGWIVAPAKSDEAFGDDSR